LPSRVGRSAEVHFEELMPLNVDTDDKAVNDNNAAGVYMAR
jgi:hypothetical protein